MIDAWELIRKGLLRVAPNGDIEHFDSYRRRFKVLAQTLDHKGYLNVCLIRNKERVRICVHRIVVMYHNHQPIPDDCEVHHKDRNTRNNAIDNLEVLTKEEHYLEHNPTTYDF